MGINTVRPYAIMGIEGPQTDIDTEATGSELPLAVVEAPVASLRRAQVADARQHAARAGSRPPLHGVWHESSCGVKWYAQGTVAVAADGDDAVATAQTHIIAAAMQAAPVLQTASGAAAVGQTTTKIVDNASGAHTPPDSDSTTDVGLVQVEYPSGSGRCIARPYIPSSGTDLDLLFALPQALGEGDVIYGGIDHSYCREPRDAADQYLITARIYGIQDVQNAAMVGCASILKAPALGPDGFPVMEAELHPALVELEIAGPAPAEGSAEPQCLAGGEQLIGIVGETTLHDVWPLRISWENIPSGLVKVTRQGSLSGLQLWDRAAEPLACKVQIPKRVTPDDFGISASTDSWYAAFAAGELDAVRMHVQDSKGGGVPGASLHYYLPDGSIVQVEDGGDLDGEESWMLTLHPTIGSDYPPIKILEG